MKQIHRKININAPATALFSFVADARNLIGLWPSLTHVQNWHRNEDGLASFAYTYHMFGFDLKGTIRETLHQPTQRIETVSEGGIQSQIHWVFESEDATSTQILFDANYDVDLPLVGRLAEKRVAAINALEITTLLSNLKKKFEYAPQPSMQFSGVSNPLRR